MVQVTKQIPYQLDVDGSYAVRVRTVNAFGAASAWSQSLLVGTNVGFRRFVWTETGPVYYFENGKVLASLYESDKPRKNYLKNPSFEDGLTGWVRTGSAAQQTLSISTTYLFTEFSARVEISQLSATVEMGVQTDSTQYVAATPGQAWGAAAYVLGSHAGILAKAQLQFYNAGLTLIGVGNNTPVNTADGSTFIRAAAGGTAPAETAWVGLKVSMAEGTPVGRWILVDGVILEQVSAGSSPGSYFDGGTVPEYASWDGVAHQSSSTLAAATATFTLNQRVNVGGSYNGVVSVYGEGQQFPDMFMSVGQLGLRRGANLVLADSDLITTFMVEGSSGISTGWGKMNAMNGLMASGTDKLQISGHSDVAYALFYSNAPDPLVSLGSLNALVGFNGDIHFQIINNNVSGYMILQTDAHVRLTRGANTPTIEWASTGGTRYSYIQSTAATMSIVSDAGDVSITAGGGEIRANDAIYQSGSASRFVTSTLIYGGSNSAYLNFYSDASSLDSVGTRSGYIGFPGSNHMYIFCEHAGGSLILEGQANIDYYSGSVYQARLSSAGDFLVSKTALDTTTIGIGLYGAGRVYTTTGNATAYNLITNIVAAQSGDVHLNFRRTDAIIGSVTTTAALTGVQYNVTSDMRLKGGIKEIDDDEALSVIKKLHPVRYQWRYDKDGEPTPDGEPKGPYEIGFLAQELHEAIPQIVTPGKGNWDDHKKWQEKKKKYSEIAEKREAFDRLKSDEQKRRTAPPELPEKPDDIPPFIPWMSDHSRLVPVLASGMQALIRRVDEVENSNKQQKEIDDLKKEIAWLRELIEKK